MIEIEIEICCTDFEIVQDALKDLIAIMSDEISREIDREIMRELSAIII